MTMVSEDERYSYSFIKDLITENVVSISAFRAYFILEYNDGVLDEKASIPFITTPIYPVLLFGYLVLKRFTWLFERVIRRNQPNLKGHVLMITSTATYRFRPLILVARELPKPITILCTRSTKEKIEEEGIFGDSYNVLSHNDIHQLVPIRSVLYALFDAWRINRRVAGRLEVESVRSQLIGYNLVLTELIKSSSFDAANSGLDSFHTQSASPYAFENVDDNKLYLYQHGQGISMTNRIAAADCNLTYFVWGPGWRPEYHCSPEAIETIDFVSIGNPVYDEMIERRSERSDQPAYDVLFFGQSHVLGKWKSNRYEEYVRTIVEVCESNDYRLAIKLHPHEDVSYYDRRGWGQYVVDDQIQEIILKSRVTITDYSSAFLESVILGSPAVLTQLMRDITDPTLAKQIPGVYLTDSIDEIAVAIETAVKAYPIPVSTLDESGVFNLGNTSRRIVQYVTADPDERTITPKTVKERSETDAD